MCVICDSYCVCVCYSSIIGYDSMSLKALWTCVYVLGFWVLAAVVAVLVLAFVFNRRTRLWACKQSSGSIATFQIKSCCVIVLVVLRMKRKWPPGNIHTYIHTYIQHCCCCCCTVFSNDSPGFELFWLLNYIFIWTIIAKIIHYYYECLHIVWEI